MLSFFSINPEYNEDNEILIKAFHVITLNYSEETKVHINDNKPRKISQLNRQWIKTKRALGVKAMLVWKNDRLKKEKLFNSLCYQQLDDTY